MWIGQFETSESLASKYQADLRDEIQGELIGCKLWTLEELHMSWKWRKRSKGIPIFERIHLSSSARNLHHHNSQHSLHPEAHMLQMWTNEGTWQVHVLKVRWSPISLRKMTKWNLRKSQKFPILTSKAI